jgi:tape measure domain-containing protein
MALNIGNVNFSVDADTNGLRAAVKDMEQFRKTIDEVAKSQDKGASQAAAALGRQESAIKRAFQATLNLQRQIRDHDKNSQSIGLVTKAYRKLIREMKSGRLTATQFSRSMDGFNASLGRQSRALKTLKAQDAAKRFSRFNEVVRDLESASVLAVGPLSGLGARIRALGAITSRSTLKIAGFLAATAGMIIGTVKLAQGALTASRAMQQIDAGLRVATGSSELAERSFENVRAISNELGIDIKSSAVQFAQLSAAARGTTLEGAGVEKVFRGIAVAAAALKLRGDQTEGALRAVQQMMSKGTVQAEELRGQLGERIPGAFGLAAAAMKVTTQELGDMLKAGDILAEDMLPKLATLLIETFGDEASRNAELLNGSINLLTNAVFDFNLALDRTIGVTSTATGLIQSLTGAIKFLSDNMKGIAASFTGIGIALAALGLPGFIRLVMRATTAMFAWLASISAVSGALAATPWGRIISLLVRIGAVATGAAIGFSMMKDDVSLATTKTQKFIDQLESVIKVSKQAKGIAEANRKQFQTEATEKIRLAKAQTDANIAEIARLRGELDQGFGKNEDHFAGIKNSWNDFTGGYLTKIGVLQAENRNFAVSVGLMERMLLNLNTIPTFEIPGGKDDDAARATKKLAKDMEKLAEKVADNVDPLRTLNSELEAFMLLAQRAEGKKLMEEFGSGVIDDAAMDKITSFIRDLSPVKDPFEDLRNNALILNQIIDSDLAEAFPHLRDLAMEALFEINEGMDLVLNKGGKEAITELSKFAEKAAENIQDSFADFLFDPFEDGVEGMLDNFLDFLRRAAAEAAAAHILDAISGGAGAAGLFKTAGTAIGSFFGVNTAAASPKAKGGVTHGTILVGERGPELLTPPGGSRVTPLEGLGGGQTVVQVINNVPNAEPEVSTERQPDGTDLVKVVLNAVSKSISSNGIVGQAIDGRRGKRVQPVVR